MLSIMELKIERLSIGDWQRGLENVRIFWEHPPSEKKIKSFLAKDTNVFVVAELDGKQVGQVIGYILERWDSHPPMFFIYTIDVAPHAQRKRIGTRMIEKIREIWRMKGCGIAFVFTNAENPPAMEFYKSTGAIRPNMDDVMYDYIEGEPY